MNPQVREIELTIEEAKAHIDLNKALERLQSNADFKKIINEGYLKNEAIRLVHAKSNPGLQSAESQAAVIRDIDGIGSLLTYLRGIRQVAEQAESAMEQANATLVEIAAEDAAEG